VRSPIAFWTEGSVVLGKISDKFQTISLFAIGKSSYECIFSLGFYDLWARLYQEPSTRELNTKRTNKKSFAEKL
jgi:hypothetical protein